MENEKPIKGETEILKSLCNNEKNEICPHCIQSAETSLGVLHICKCCGKIKEDIFVQETNESVHHSQQHEFNSVLERGKLLMSPDYIKKSLSELKEGESFSFKNTDLDDTIEMNNCTIKSYDVMLKHETFLVFRLYDDKKYFFDVFFDKTQLNKLLIFVE